MAVQQAHWERTVASGQGPAYRIHTQRLVLRCWHPTDAPPLATVELENESLSVSAVWGRSFRAGEKNYGHIIDPRTGQPAAHARMSAVILPDATESDALSTALLTAPELLVSLAQARPRIRCLVVRETNGEPAVLVHGIVLAEKF